ncbi:MAG: TIGR00725 family protein [Candidatus Thermoplasmatota archaeon]
MRRIIAVCGSDGDDLNLSDYALSIAERVGFLIAEHGGVLLCGGRGGVMEAACKGAKSAGGLTIGILPYSKEEANSFVDIAIPTGLGNIRNYIVAGSADSLIAVGGRWGTLNEITYGMITRKRVILLKGTGGCVDQIISSGLLGGVQPSYYIAKTAEEAVDLAFLS